VNDRGPLLEVNLFDVAPDLYGRKLRVQFIDFIRPEMKFSGLDELKAQIARDAEVAREKLSG
jgi:riboflavin kinase/FMN adenylyltransferase